MKIFTLILPLAALVCLAPRLHAGCDSPPNDGWGSNYSSYAAWCRACGGTPYSSPGVGCRPGSNWGVKAPAAPGFSAGQLRREEEERAAAEAVLKKKAARKKREEEEKRRRDDEEKARFRRGQAEGVKNLKGGPAGAGGLKGVGPAGGLKGAGDACVREEDFRAYRAREEERRRLLGNLKENLASGRTDKRRADWCKLNIPLPPSPAAAGYCEKKPVYEARLEEWRQKCSAVAAPLPPARAAGTVKPEPRGDAADCLGVYDGEVKACAADDLRAAACVNSAVASYLRCLTGEAPRVGGGQ